MAVLDANVFVAIYKTDDVHHAASRAWLARYLPSRQVLDLPYLILSEVAGAIARPTGDRVLADSAVAQVQQVPRVTFYVLDAAVGRLAAQLASELRLRGADAVYTAVGVQLQVGLITWDRELHDRAAQRIPTYYPDEV